jgi:hypothetical protein
VNKLLVVPTLGLLVFQGACTTRSSGPMPTEPPVEVRPTGAPGQVAASRTRTERLEVMAVDPVGRTISLKQPTGEVETMAVGKSVEGLEQVRVGDVLVAQYDEGLALELQPADSRDVPETTIQVPRRSAADAVAGVGGATGTQATVLVVAVDRVARTVVFELPNGERRWVKAGQGVQLQNVNLGDRLLATYVQSMVVRLERQESRGR